MKLLLRFLSTVVCTLALICIIAGCSSPKSATPPSSSPDLSDSNPANNPTKSPTKKEITITLDNWDTYFEFVEKEEEYKNDYNETTHIQHYYSLDLKEQYTLDEVDIKIDYSYQSTTYNTQYDLANKKIIWGDVMTGPNEKTNELEIQHDERTVAGEYFMIFGDHKEKCTDFEVNRIYGTLVIIE